MGDTPGSQTISTKLQRIAKQARDYPQMVFDNVYHLIDEELLREAYRRTRKDAAVGVDKVTGEEYGQALEDNLRDLHERLREHRYVAPPVERVWIGKEDGSARPVGISCFEDKIVQRAGVMLLEAIYEPIFYGVSHGFRAGRSAHQALAELRQTCMSWGIQWIADVDVRAFFDSIDKKQLYEFLKRRVRDGGILRLIGKWLNAGVVEGGSLSYPDAGTPQGGVISPMLANIYLHYVLDEWFIQEVQPRLRGRSYLTRYADDFVIGFELESDARRVMQVLPKRFGRFHLEIHPEKTKLVCFQRPSSQKKVDRGSPTFDYLGFTHYWGKSRRGNWIIKRKTRSKKLRGFMKRMWLWCRGNRHKPLQEQHKALCAKLKGHYGYYGIRGNYKMLEVAFEHVDRAWQFWLSRRSYKSYINWEKFEVSVRQKWPLAKPRIVHVT